MCAESNVDINGVARNTNPQPSAEGSVSRRDFLQGLGAAGIVAGGLARAQSKDTAAVRFEKLAGEQYRAGVPDTLDLAERARLAVNGLTGTADPDNHFESYHCANLTVHPAYMNHVGDEDCQPKVLEALPMMRLMSGSDQNLDVHEKMLQGRTFGPVSDVGDGLFWIRKAGRPWPSRQLEEDIVDVMGHSRLMLALMAHYGWQRDPRWMKVLRQMADGLDRIVVREGDSAYYPSQRYYQSGWRIQADRPRSGPGAADGYAQGNALQALSRWAALAGDEKALNLAAKLARPLVWTGRWRPSAQPKMMAGAERGHFAAHFHSATVMGLGLMLYASVANDTAVKAFVQGFYEYARNFGISRIGFFPGRVGDHGSFRAPDGKTFLPTPSEGCGIAEMIRLAIGLSDAGVGDYWDDVDQYVRNNFVELQLIDRQLLQEISEAGRPFTLRPGMTGDRVIDRCVGTFPNASDPTAVYSLWTMCCVGNCSVALYRAWESILRHTDGVSQVNLLLNRASPWLDVESHLPYEGKVVLRVKSSRRAHVRIPRWVDKKAVRCQFGNQNAPLSWLNNYLLIDGLTKRDVVTITFPMVETTERFTEPAYGITYTLRMKGNTLVDISPRPEEAAVPDFPQDDRTITRVARLYPMYRREHYKASRAPMKELARYAAATII